MEFGVKMFKKYKETTLKDLSKHQLLKAVNAIFDGKAIYETKKKDIVYFGDMDYNELLRLLRGY